MNKHIIDPLLGAPCERLTLSIIAEKLSMNLVGEDREVFYLSFLSQQPQEYQSNFLTFISGEKYIEQFIKNKFEAAIISNDTNLKNLPNKRSYLITQENPLDAFFLVHLFIHKYELYGKVDNHMGTNCQISKSVTIKECVSIGNNCEIEENVVIYPNTIIEDNVKIKANTVIGGNGFEVKIIDGDNMVVPHWGGTYLGNNVEIGSMTTIDRSLQHAFTYVGDETKLSNQVQIAHGARIGERSLIAGHAQIANAEIGDNVIFGAASCCNSKLRIGNFAFVGIGSVVMNHVPNHAMVFGNPARRFSWVCACRETIKFDIENLGSCERCRQKYLKKENHIQPVNNGSTN